MAGFPVVFEHEAIGTKAEHTTHAGQAGVGTSGVVVTTGSSFSFVDASAIVSRESHSWTTIARALETTHQISAGVLAWSPAIVT